MGPRHPGEPFSPLVVAQQRLRGGGATIRQRGSLGWGEPIACSNTAARTSLRVDRAVAGRTRYVTRCRNAAGAVASARAAELLELRRTPYVGLRGVRLPQDRRGAIDLAGQRDRSARRDRRQPRDGLVGRGRPGGSAVDGSAEGEGETAGSGPASRSGLSVPLQEASRQAHIVSATACRAPGLTCCSTPR